MTTHELKIWPDFFASVTDGTKKYEIRKNDRDFKVGDFLQLREWNPRAQYYTGRQATVKVTHVTRGSDEPIGDLLSFNVCVLGIEVLV
jgi:hypothetical protein